MNAKQIIVALNEDIYSFRALEFALTFFGHSENKISLLWLGRRDKNHHRDSEVAMIKGNVRLMHVPYEFQPQVFRVITKFTDSLIAKVDSVSLEHFTRKQITTMCSFSDLLIISYPVFRDKLKPLFEMHTGGRKYNKVCCPKLLLPVSFEELDNVIMVKTDQVNTIGTVKQFCHVFGDYCDRIKLTVLDMQEYSDYGGFLNTQRMLVNYLRQHSSGPAVYPYSGEDNEHLNDILNITENTIWVSPLESVVEMQFLENTPMHK